MAAREDADDAARAWRRDAARLRDAGGEPELPPALYAARLARLRERMARRGYDHLVVYADREHSANLAYLTGFDPRFEEAILIVGTGRRSGDPRRQRVLGHGRRGAAADAPPSVPGPEPAEPAARPVAAAAPRSWPRRASGRRAGRRHRLEDVCRPEQMRAPAYLVDALRAAVGRAARRERQRTC